jgi:hypothetical protein
VGIGKQCAGAGHDTGRSRYWQAMSWHWTQYREEWVLASNALALDATGYKRDLARVRA